MKKDSGDQPRPARERVHIRLRPEARPSIERRLQEVGMTFSDYVRWLIFNDIGVRL